MFRLLYDSNIIISGTAPHPTQHTPVHIGRPYRLIIISGTSAMSGATSGTAPPGCGATSAANYMVILTPPAASAGRDSIEDFGLGGAGGAIVTGT